MKTDDAIYTASLEPPNGTGSRALHVISGLFFGGGQRVVLDLLRALPLVTDVDLQLCLLGDFAGSPLGQRCDRVIAYDGRYNSPRVLWATSRRLRQTIRDLRPDIVHTHGVDADLIGALAVRGTGANHVCHLHISPPANRKESRKAAIRRHLFRFLTRRSRAWFIAVSDAVRQQMAEYYGLPLERITTVRNGVDLTEFAPAHHPTDIPTHRPTVFGTAARLAPMKGLEHLIQAASALNPGGVDFEVRIAGSGNYREELQSLIDSAGMSSYIHLVGHVDDMPPFYADLDVFVLPSLSEGLPLVVLEAMAMGRPVVATPVGGTPEVIRDGMDGILVPPGDVAALVAAMKELGQNEALRARMGCNAQERVQSDFSIERVARQVAAVYERVLGS